jgi:FKBP-type peptidyl-prolyl cis-trans isomerase FkpA
MKLIPFARATAILFAAGLVVLGCKGTPGGAAGGSAPASTPPAAETPAPGASEHKLASGLVYQDLVVGDGPMAEAGMTAVVHYTGWLTNGTKFDSSLDRGRPFPFVLGQHDVIDGWDQGVKGMRVGGKRKLTVPPELGYGAQGMGGVIPPNATLVFEVQLLEVRRADPAAR